MGQDCLSILHLSDSMNKINSFISSIKSVGIYYPIYDEISPLKFIEYFSGKNIKIALPKIQSKTKILLFNEWNQNENLITGPLGNLEPSNNNFEILPQLLILPMLSFDKNFNRLGYGGGYYDKTINYLRKHFQILNKNFFVIGLAYSGQETKKIPEEKHDEKLDYILTENSFFINKNKNN